MSCEIDRLSPLAGAEGLRGLAGVPRKLWPKRAGAEGRLSRSSGWLWAWARLDVLASLLPPSLVCPVLSHTCVAAVRRVAFEAVLR